VHAKYEFHLVAQRLQNFCSEDLGGFWLDVLKDRLYTAAAGSRARRSAQSALHHVTQVLLRLMAPILSFTAEEAWAVLHPGKDESIFFHTWKDVLPPQEGEAGLLARWRRLREIRGQVSKRLEESRAAGAIGSSLQAEVDLAAAGADHALLASLGDDLRYVLITSRAGLREAAPAAADPAIDVAPSAHPKCERCWHYRADVGSVAAHPRICARCVANLQGAGEERIHA
jgi:isoleucyl-tRNA synthetase